MDQDRIDHINGEGRARLPSRLWRWGWAHRWVVGGAIVLLGVIGLNVLAYRHAWSMTHFVPGGERPKSPEALSVWEKAVVLTSGVRLPRPENADTPEKLGLEYQVHRFPSTFGGQLEAWHVRRDASRGLILLFHGYAGSKSSLLPEAAAFDALGFDTLLVDFRGSGGSDGATTTLGYLEADDVTAAAEFARTRLMSGAPILYGQSMGSAAILRAIHVGLRPKAAILECPFNRLSDTVGNRFAAMGLPSFPCAQLLIFWGGVQHGYSGFSHNPAAYARDVHCPVLLMHGVDDPRVTADQAAEVFANLAGDKRFVSFEGVGHEPYLLSRSGEWKAATAEFFEAIQQ